MKSLIRFAVIISFFGILLLSFHRVGNSAPQGLTLNVTEPADRSYTNQTKVTVAGNVNTEGATVTANGTDLAVASDNTFRGQISLPNEGPNPIEIRATVGAKSVVSVTRTVFRDTIAPTLLVSQPADGATVDAAQVEVRGSAADASSFTVTVNGVPAKIVGGKDALWFVTVPLVPGFNQIYVQVVDAAGNITSLTRSVTRPGAPLSLIVTEPGDGAFVNSTKPLVSGLVTGSNVTLTVNNQPVQVSPDGSFSAETTVVEGGNTIQIVATDQSGARQETKRAIIVDTKPPVLSSVTPAPDTFIPTPQTIVQGRVSDASPVEVRVADLSATVTPCLSPIGCPFALSNVPVAEGIDYLWLIATDAAGNSAVQEIKVRGKDVTAPTAPVLFPVTSPTRLTFQTIEGRAEPGATISITGGQAPVATSAALGTGLFMVNVNLTNGTNPLSVVATDAEGNVSLPAQVAVVSNPALSLPPPGQPSQISVAFGNGQFGLPDRELPRPLVVFVSDKDGNPVSNVAVRFSVTQGGGSFAANRTSTLEARTDAQGHATARYLPKEIGVQMIQADCTGNQFAPAVFMAEAKESFGGVTSVSGVVLDQNLRALPNVWVRLGGQQTRTRDDGRFRLMQVSSGPHQLLEIIGRDQVPFPGRWPNISYDIDVLPGIDNRQRRPLFLPRVNEGVAMPLNANNVFTQDLTVELPILGGQPPVRVTARAGTQVVFPPDVSDRRLSVTQIPVNRIPMGLEDGRATNLYISVQPSGAVFDPPLEVTFPNLDQEPPNARVLLMSFDHDAGRYVQVGTGKVSADGQTVTGDPGSGIRIGAWHGFPPPAPKPRKCLTGDSDECTLEAWVDDVPGMPIGDAPSASGRAADDSDALTRFAVCVLTDAPTKKFEGQSQPCPKIRFLRQGDDQGNRNVEIPIDGSNESCLMVSKFVTSENLPLTDVNFDGDPINTTPDFLDPDTFRVQATSDSVDPSVRAYSLRLEVYTGPTGNRSKIFEIENPMERRDANGKSMYRTRKYMRLLSNDEDALVGEATSQTPKVQLQDSVIAKLINSKGEVVKQKEISIGRPSAETGINAVRVVKCRFIKVDDPKHNVVTKADINDTLRRLNELWAQCAVKFESIGNINNVPVVIPIKSSLLRIRILPGPPAISGTIKVDVIDANGNSTEVTIQISQAQATDTFLIAQQIENEINRKLGSDTVKAFNTVNLPNSNSSIVFPKKNQNQVLKFKMSTLSSVFIESVLVDLGDGEVFTKRGQFEYESAWLVGSYSDSDLKTYDIFIVNSFSNLIINNKPFIVYGLSFSKSIFGDSMMINSTLLRLGVAQSDPQNKISGFNTPAHEAGHILIDNNQGTSEGHFLASKITDNTKYIMYENATPNAKRFTRGDHILSRERNEGKLFR